MPDLGIHQEPLHQKPKLVLIRPRLKCTFLTLPLLCKPAADTQKKVAQMFEKLPWKSGGYRDFLHPFQHPLRQSKAARPKSSHCTATCEAGNNLQGG